MTARRAIAGALCVVLLAALVVRVTGGSDPYRVSVPLTNGSGLQDGSAVKVGGVTRGKVALRLGKGDQVFADLEFEDDAPAIGRDARVSVVAANFLGLKRVELEPGDGAGEPAPSGFVLAKSRVTTPTDLDQVLGVFDADTRTRAKVLLTEAGEAVVGRKVDISSLLAQFPGAIDDAGAVLDQLATDDRTMRDLLIRSDRFVAQVTTERRALGRLVDTVGKTAETVNAKRAELRQTLAQAPATLRTLQGFLADLEGTTTDLGPAAREISTAAPAVSAALAEVDGFRDAARPTLATATEVAPSLTALAKGATPVLRRARPTVGAAAQLARTLPPVTDALDGSSDNIIAILENWSRAIQFRDQLGHVFRGEASLTPDLILTMVDRLAKDAKKSKVKASGERRQPGAKITPAPQTTAPAERQPRLPKLPEAPLAPVKPTVDKAKELLNGLLGGADKPAPRPSPEQVTSSALDYLLGP